MAVKPKRASTRIPVAKVEANRIVVRVVLVALAFIVLVFAVEGGEYGTTDLMKQNRSIAMERARVDSLERAIERLQLERKAIEGDPLTQERIAREEFGMVKGDRELLYRFTDTVTPP